MPSLFRLGAIRGPFAPWSTPTTVMRSGVQRCQALISLSTTGAEKSILTLTSTASFPRPSLRLPPLLAGTPLTISANWSVTVRLPEAHFKDHLFGADLLAGGNVFADLIYRGTHGILLPPYKNRPGKGRLGSRNAVAWSEIRSPEYIELTQNVAIATSWLVVDRVSRNSERKKWSFHWKRLLPF
jgi:hypothetical protein